MLYLDSYIKLLSILMQENREPSILKNHINISCEVNMNQEFMMHSVDKMCCTAETNCLVVSGELENNEPEIRKAR